MIRTEEEIRKEIANLRKQKGNPELTIENRNFAAAMRFALLWVINTDHSDLHKSTFVKDDPVNDMYLV